MALVITPTHRMEYMGRNLTEQIYKNFHSSPYDFQCQGTIYSYFQIGLKPAVVSCLTNTPAPLLIAQESFSRA